MNSKINRILIPLFLGWAVWGGGGCCAAQKIPGGFGHHGHPEIDQQTRDAVTSTNRASFTLLRARVRDGADEYQYAWFKEVLADCRGPSDNAAISYQIARFATATNNILIITNAVPSDRGSYFCLITRVDCDADDTNQIPYFLQTRTRSTYLQVYENTNVFQNGRPVYKMAAYSSVMSAPQVVTSPLIPGGASGNKCSFVFNGSFPFKVDDQGKYFTCPANANKCVVTAYKVTGAGDTQLLSSEFNIAATIVGGSSVCANPGDGNSRTFSAVPNKRYNFCLYLKNAGNFSYKISVQFN